MASAHDLYNMHSYSCGHIGLGRFTCIPQNTFDLTRCLILNMTKPRTRETLLTIKKKWEVAGDVELRFGCLHCITP